MQRLFSLSSIVDEQIWLLGKVKFGAELSEKQMLHRRYALGTHLLPIKIVGWHDCEEAVSRHHLLLEAGGGQHYPAGEAWRDSWVDSRASSASRKCSTTCVLKKPGFAVC